MFISKHHLCTSIVYHKNVFKNTRIRFTCFSSDYLKEFFPHLSPKMFCGSFYHKYIHNIISYSVLLAFSFTAISNVFFGRYENVSFSPLLTYLFKLTFNRIENSMVQLSNCYRTARQKLKSYECRFFRQSRPMKWLLIMVMD